MPIFGQHDNISALLWPLDTQLFHAGLKCGAFDIEEFGGPVFAADAPVRHVEGLKDMLPLAFFQG